MSPKPTPRKVERQAHLRWVPVNKMRINALAQRELNPSRVNKLASEMELEQLGYPTVNFRDDWYFIIDGQHRVEALKKFFGDDDPGTIQCYCYDGDNALTAEDEAEVFLKQNDTLAVSSFEKFRIAIQAGRTEECDIDRIVRAQNLRISREKGGGAIRAVAALRKVYRLGPKPLARGLRILRDAYGDAGLEGPFIEGIGLMCSRYNGELQEDLAVTKLGDIHGGANGLMNSAESLRVRTGNPRAHCVAAAAVDIYNRGKGSKKLPSWWRAES